MGVTLDTELDVAALQALTATSREIFLKDTGEEFPHEPRDQLEQAIRLGRCLRRAQHP